MIANEWIFAYLTNQAFKAIANNETIQNMTAHTHTHIAQHKCKHPQQKK